MTPDIQRDRSGEKPRLKIRELPILIASDGCRPGELTSMGLTSRGIRRKFAPCYLRTSQEVLQQPPKEVNPLELGADFYVVARKDEIQLVILCSGRDSDLEELDRFIIEILEPKEVPYVRLAFNKQVDSIAKKGEGVFGDIDDLVKFLKVRFKSIFSA